MAAGESITAEERATYLRLLAEGNSHTIAAKGTGRGCRTFRSLRQADEAFALEVAQAADDGAGEVEQKVFDWALGREKCPSYQAFLSAMALLKARREEYRTGSKVEVTGPGGGPIRHKTEVTQRDAADALRGLVDAGLVEPGRAAVADPSGEPVPGS